MVRKAHRRVCRLAIGLLSLAGQTPDDVDVDYIEVADLSEVEGGALPTGYDLVGISSFTAQAYEMYELADRYRAEGVPVVLGGLHVSALPEEAAAHADAVCVGEGELLWPRVVEDFRSGGPAALQPLYREEAPGRLDLGSARPP